MFNNEDDDLDDPLNRLLAEEIVPIVPGPGGFMPSLPLVPEPIPPATPETMVCLRGPCKYYVEIVSMFQHGNTKGTLERAPRQQNRFCRAIEGTDIDLTDELVFECNTWEPLLKAETLVRTARRAQWAAEQEESNE